MMVVCGGASLLFLTKIQRRTLYSTLLVDYSTLLESRPLEKRRLKTRGEKKTPTIQGQGKRRSGPAVSRYKDDDGYRRVQDYYFSSIPMG
jgi:hypothetical protein